MSRMTAGSLGKIPTTLVRRLISLVEPLERVGGPDLAPVRRRERRECEQIRTGVVEPVRDHGKLSAQHESDLIELGGDVLSVG